MLLVLGHRQIDWFRLQFKVRGVQELQELLDKLELLMQEILDKLELLMQEILVLLELVIQEMQDKLELEIQEMHLAVVVVEQVEL
jgi:hypothetical protein